MDKVARIWCRSIEALGSRIRVAAAFLALLVSVMPASGAPPSFAGKSDALSSGEFEALYDGVIRVFHVQYGCDDVEEIRAVKRASASRNKSGGAYGVEIWRVRGCGLEKHFPVYWGKGFGDIGTEVPRPPN